MRCKLSSLHSLGKSGGQLGGGQLGGGGAGGGGEGGGGSGASLGGNGGGMPAVVHRS